MQVVVLLPRILRLTSVTPASSTGEAARIEPLPDGRIAYRMKTPRRGRTHRVMTPLEFLARIASLVPPSRIPALRYTGVFAAGSRLRPLVTPKPPVTHTPPPPPCPSLPDATPATPPALSRPHTPVTPAPERAGVVPASPLDVADIARITEPSDPLGLSTITVRHWDRLLQGLLLATSPRIDWATLLRRTFGFDALRCPGCSGRLRICATLTDPIPVRRILEHLGLRADPLEFAPARDPTDEQPHFGFEPQKPATHVD